MAILSATAVSGNVVDFERGHISMVARHIVSVSVPDNPDGFTINPFTQRSPKFDDRVFPNMFYVSILGHERVFEDTPSLEDVREWLTVSYVRLCTFGHYISYWRHGGKNYLDVTKVIFGRERALAFGRANNQHSILRLCTKEEIPID